MNVYSSADLLGSAPSRPSQDTLGGVWLPPPFAGQATSFCWDLSLVRPALVSRCSLWPSTQSSGGDAARPPPFSSGAQGLLHSSVSFLGLSSLPLPRESMGAYQTVLYCSSGPCPCSPFCLSVPPTGLVEPWCLASASLYQACPAGAVLVLAH